MAYEIIAALDTGDLEQAADLAGAIAEHPNCRALKVGFALGLSHGLPAVVARLARAAPRLPLIYDHQKAGTDIPDTGALFARTLAHAGISEVILFPLAGPVTQQVWIEACLEQGLKVIVGAVMTHTAYIASEGGYLRDTAALEIYSAAYAAGVRAFVVPLTRPEHTRQLIAAAGLDAECEYYSPGYGAQGGNPAAFDFIRRHYLIIGRSLASASDPKAYIDDILAGMGERA